jgi:Asp-tRNA(Asn)/Glu-tRNA(Gln) amidotransferase A subunit family amidase
LTRYQVANIASADGIYKSVAVPSRLYHQQSSAHPLAGARIAISDRFQVYGLKTTMSSRAWQEMYGPATDTADFVKKLISLGAVVVGKVKTTQYGVGREWVDVRYPMNPRGDGYQELSRGCAGAAAAVAGYEWLDHAIAMESRLQWL